MNHTFYAALFAGGLFLGMLLLMEAGRRIAVRRIVQDADGARAGAGAVEGGIFALLGLLVAFTFSGAGTRFDARRQLVIEEANAIGTAYLRLELLPSDAQPEMRERFRAYLDSRLEVYRRLPDIQAAKAELAHSEKLQAEIWSRAVAICREQNYQPATMLLLPALNQMIDITTTRTVAAQTHPPPIIFAMLGALALVSSLLAGYGMAGGKRRSWLHVLGFSAILAATVYVILDLEYPRLGLIRVDAADQVLVDLRQSMK